MQRAMARHEGALVPNFRLDVSDVDGVSVIEVHGEVDLREAEVLLAAIQDSSGPLVVDLCDCEYMGSPGLVALLNGRMVLQGREQRFIVAYDAEDGMVRRLFQAVGARQILPLYESREEALSAAALTDRRSGVDRRV
jgi:anti-anti-sigma factor